MPNISFYKTNIVKCLPLNENGKIRYPNNDEIYSCMPNLILEIETINPKIIFLLGGLVAKSFRNYINRNIEYNYLLNDYKVIEIKHPSYVYIYKRKNLIRYTEEIINLINDDEIVISRVKNKC